MKVNRLDFLCAYNNFFLPSIKKVAYMITVNLQQFLSVSTRVSHISGNVNSPQLSHKGT